MSYWHDRHRYLLSLQKGKSEEELSKERRNAKLFLYIMGWGVPILVVLLGFCTAIWCLIYK